MGMSQIALQPNLTNSSRMRALIVPREHGAWGLLLIPLISGAATALFQARHWTPLGLFTLAAVALFWLRTPLESSLGAAPMRVQSNAEVNVSLAAVAALGSVAFICIAVLLWGGDNLGLLAIGGTAALAFLAQSLLKQVGRRMRMAAQLMGAIGLTSTAAGAYYVVTGHLDTRAAALWIANWIFAGDQIHYVQLRIHSAHAVSWAEKFQRGRTFFFGQFVVVGILVVGWRLHLLPGLAVLAFVPVLMRGLLWYAQGPRPLAVRRLIGLCRL